jgi:hypothetical protein
MKVGNETVVENYVLQTEYNILVLLQIGTVRLPNFTN